MTQRHGLDHERCYRAVASRDARFDGQFVTAVTSTGIYCRPSCPAVTPRRKNVIFLPTAAAAQARGFRACRRCLPDAASGSPQWAQRSDVVARAMRMVVDGAVDRSGVLGVAASLGYSTRQLNRIVAAELGAGLAQIARAQRAQTARTLLETSEMPISQVAWAAGFGSVRQFNDTIQEVFDTTPSHLRAQAQHRAARGQGSQGGFGGRGPGAAPGAHPADGGGGPTPAALRVRLAARTPIATADLLGFLGTRAIPGVERWDGATFTRALDLPHGPGLVRLTAPAGLPEAQFHLQDVRDLGPAVARVRRLLDLDADPVAVDSQLGDDPVLGGLVRARPGLRVVGCLAAEELVVRAIVGQQVSVAGARTTLGRLAQRYGQPVDDLAEQPLVLFPSCAALAQADPADLGMPVARGRTVVTVAGMIADGELQLGPGADRAEALDRILAVPGIGPWTAGYVAMRGLGDPDVLLDGDLGVRRALGRVAGPISPAAAARNWRPWRSYAVAHLWASLADPAPGGSLAAAAQQDPTQERPARGQAHVAVLLHTAADKEESR